MKFFYSVIIICIYFFMLLNTASAETEKYDSYILKYKYDDKIHIITAEEKERLLDNTNNRQSRLYNINKDIEYIEPNYDVTLFDAISKDWNINIVNASFPWEYGCYGNGIKIAILDSGIGDFPSLKYNALLGYNVIDYSHNIVDKIGHGTFVSGIIANGIGNEYSEGIAKKAEIIPIKCFDKNYSTKVDKIVEAIEYAVNVCNCDIINMSFGINGNSAYLKSKIDDAIQKNVIIVSAVGNNGSNSLRYPAAYDGVIGVGAIDETYSHCDFSQHNNSVDLVAPGEKIYGISIDGYNEHSGTSFATPHVTAAAAIALSIDKKLTPLDFENILKITSTDLGDYGYDEYYGYGLLNIEKITTYLMNQQQVFMSPISIDKGIANVTVYNNTLDDIEASNIFIELENQRINNLKISNVCLHTKEKIQLSYDVIYNDYKCFLWDDVYTMIPLCESRQEIK